MLTTVIGVDPSVSKTGVVIRREDGSYSSFLCVPPAKAQDPARLYWIAATVVSECKLPAECEVLLVIEHPTPRRQLEINFPLYWRLREEFAWHYQVRTLSVWPATLNKFAAPKGVSEIGAAVVRQWGGCLPDESNPDVLDALALCKFGEFFNVVDKQQLSDSPPYPRCTKEQWDVVQWDGTGAKRRERVAVDDTLTFRICKGGE
jgi:hypothetical protein